MEVTSMPRIVIGPNSEICWISGRSGGFRKGRSRCLR
jgi:hypothetical protein